MYVKKFKMYLAAVVLVITMGTALVVTLNHKMPQQTGAPLVIGVFLEDSKSVKELTSGVWQGIEMAVEEVNSSGGVNGQLLKAERNNLKEGKELWENNQCIAAMGGLTQESTDTLTEEANKYGKLFLTINSSAAKTEAESKAYQVGMDDRSQGLVAASFAVQKNKSKRAVVVTEAGSAYSKTLARAFAEEYLRLGGQVAEVLTVNEGSTNVTEIIKKMKLLKPDLVYCPVYGKTGAALINQGEKGKLQVNFLGGDAWEGNSFLSNLNKDVKNPIFYTSANLLPLSEAQGFREMYRTRYGVEPLPQALWAYEGVKMLAAALKEGKNPEGVQEVFNSGQKLGVIGGEFTFSNSHEAIRPMAVVTIEERSARIKEIIVPEQ